MFARRALSKINELHELELASINGEKGGQALEFREATIKVKKIIKTYYFLFKKFQMTNLNLRLELSFSNGSYLKVDVKPRDF